ncbi:MAG: ABC transporter permease [Anaerolineae bacterium]|nr:ABC transporter permease [Anaerolineae bacterium]
MTVTGNRAKAVGPKPSWRGDVSKLARTYGLQIGIFCVLLVIWGLFVVGAPQTFLSPNIYAAYMSTIPFFAVIALPLTMIIIAGEMDLSFPSIMGVGMVAFTNVLTLTNSVALAFIASLAAGSLVGLLNGVIVVRLGIPSLVATLGTQFFWRGFVLVVTDAGGFSLVPIKGTVLRQALVGRVGGYMPAQMIWAVVVAILVWIFLNRHKFGAHVYLIGDNVESAKLMGVNVDRTRIINFAILGTAAAFGGVLSSLEQSYFWVSLGEGYLLKTMASAFLGGTSVFGGVGTIFGTFIGCLIIGAIEAGIVAIGKIEIFGLVIKLSGFWTQLIYGLIIVTSVSLQNVLSRRLSR